MRRLICLGLALSMGLALSACEQTHPMTDTGAALDRAGTQAGQAIGRAGEATGNAVNRAGEWIQEKSQ
jgi:hypothetical protein